MNRKIELDNNPKYQSNHPTKVIIEVILDKVNVNKPKYKAFIQESHGTISIFPTFHVRSSSLFHNHDLLLFSYKNLTHNHIYKHK